MKWFVLAAILITSVTVSNSKPSGEKERQLEPSWECARSCKVPLSYLMAQKYRLVGQELVVVGWVTRIGQRLYLFPDRDLAIAGIYHEAVHLVPKAALVREMAGIDLIPIEVEGYVIYDSRPQSDAWMRFKVTSWEGASVMLNRALPDPSETERVE